MVCNDCTYAPSGLCVECAEEVSANPEEFLNPDQNPEPEDFPDLNPVDDDEIWSLSEEEEMNMMGYEILGENKPTYDEWDDYEQGGGIAEESEETCDYEYNTEMEGENEEDIGEPPTDGNGQLVAIRG